MEQQPKPAEAPKPKSRTMMLAIIIIVILVVVGVGVYILTRPPATTTTIGEKLTIYDGNPACTSATNCGFKDSSGNANVTIAVGTTVQWTNSGGQAHTVTSCDPTSVGTYGTSACPTTNAASLPTFNSNSIAAGSTYQYTFNTAGTYYYFCSYHVWMHGKIVVQ